MKQRAVQESTDTIGDEDALSEAELKQVSGGVFTASPFAGKPQPTVTSWSGTPYQPEEDVEAY